MRGVGLLGLDVHRQESEKHIETIQYYLRGSIETILQSLCLGFVQEGVVGSHTREALDEIYHHAIYLLYRILFLFYAEARDLLPIHDVSYQQISLAIIIAEARQYHYEGAHNSNAFSLWQRLEGLCNVIDKGKPELGIHPYNGGLFNNEKNPYFETHKIANVFLAQALFALSHMQEKNTVYTLIDYGDLSVRHLGTLYEGLLEYRLHLVENERIVVRESNGKRSYKPLSQAGTVKRSETTLEIGQIYFADDRGERKSSGSYYTPEDVVQYIVSHTVLPKLQEYSKSLEGFLAQIQSEMIIASNAEEQHSLEYYADDKIMDVITNHVLNLRILDPAMGSGHFLVAAGQVMTNFIVDLLNITTWTNPTVNSDPLTWKRRIAERCLYGVDINPLAHELAKLALWLSSASSGKPLTFLDHHLKIGNSLYGASFKHLPTFPMVKKECKNDLLHRYIHEQTLRNVIEQINKITSNDSNHIDDVQAKEDIHRETTSLTQCVEDIANIWLASLFKLKNSDGKPISEYKYLQYITELTSNYTPEAWNIFAQTRQILLAAREIAKQERFFHWEIEFPDAFVDEKRFDVIITNPPYVRTSLNEAIMTLYETAKCGDLFAWFFERVLSLKDSTGTIGLVVPLSLMFSRQFVTLRRLLLQGQVELHCSSFDNTPDVLFNDSIGGGNQQRATIVLLRTAPGPSTIQTTDLLRWLSADRSFLFTSLHYEDMTSFCSDVSFPRIGSSQIAHFWLCLKNMKRTFSDLCLEKFAETRRPNPQSIFLTVPRATRYFISATPGAMARNKVLSFSFKTKDDMDLARVLLNSNVFYWYWRAFGDGFCLGTDLVASFPIPNHVDDEYTNLAKLLDAVQEQCATSNKFRGQTIPSYNFNKRIGILINIDEWIMKQVIPDMDLPKDLFAQYKSNSFLHSYNLPEMLVLEDKSILEAEEDIVVET